MESEDFGDRGGSILVGGRTLLRADGWWRGTSRRRYRRGESRCGRRCQREVGGRKRWNRPPSAQPAGNAEQPAPQAGTEAQEEEVGKVVEAEEQAPSLPLSYAPRIVDRKGERLQVKELTLSESVGRTRCGDERAHFELKKDSEIALCFLVERTVRGRLRILWEREGVTERRSLFRIAPAKRFRSRAELKLRSGYEGSWTARIMKDNEELAAIDFRIE